MAEAGLAPDKKGALKRGAWIVFLDESGFSQRPPVRATWAPRGQTPLLIEHCNWKRLSAIGALAWRPSAAWTRLFLSMRKKSIQQPEVIEFLRSLRRHLRGPVVLVWDRLSSHRGGLVQSYLASQSHWLTVEYLPPYAPELNPVEQLWANLDARELVHYSPDDLDDLECRLECGKRRIRRTDLGLGFIKHSTLLTQRQFNLLFKHH